MDMQTAINYFKKLSNYPAEVDEFLQSKIFGDFILGLNKDFAIHDDYLTDLVIEVVVNDFDDSFIDALPTRLEKDLHIDQDKANKLLREFFGRIILPINPFVKSFDAKKKIIELGGNIDDYKYFSEKVKIFLENFYYDQVEDLVKAREEVFDVKEEANTLQNMIEKELVYLIKNPDADLNGAMVAVLFADANFKDVITRTLLANQKKLFEKEIVVDGKKFIPTVGNWLNDFISKNGRDYFNNITLSTYITNSKLTKDLNKEEKDLLIKLFSVFRNILFFPQGFQNLPPDKWEIFPLEKTGKTAMESRQTLAAPKSPEELEIENLEKMAAGYELGSLERRAVEEEIRKMKLSIKYTGAMRK